MVLASYEARILAEREQLDKTGTGAREAFAELAGSAARSGRVGVSEVHGKLSALFGSARTDSPNDGSGPRP